MCAADPRKKFDISRPLELSELRDATLAEPLPCLFPDRHIFAPRPPRRITLRASRSASAIVDFSDALIRPDRSQADARLILRLSIDTSGARFYFSLQFYLIFISLSE